MSVPFLKTAEGFPNDWSTHGTMVWLLLYGLTEKPSDRVFPCMTILFLEFHYLQNRRHSIHLFYLEQIDLEQSPFFRMKRRRLNWCHLKGPQSDLKGSQVLPCLSWAPRDRMANHFPRGGSSWKYRSWFGVIRCTTLFIFRWQAVHHSEPDRLGTVRRQ